jgi:hypothetical protein
MSETEIKTIVAVLEAWDNFDHQGACGDAGPVYRAMEKLGEMITKPRPTYKARRLDLEEGYSG